MAARDLPAHRHSREELEWKFIRASGPGGQNVNKVASAVQLRFLLPLNTSLPVPARNPAARDWPGRNSIDDGSILIIARSERSQDQNRRAALERLAELIRAALIEPKSARKPGRHEPRRNAASNRRSAAAHQAQARQADGPSGRAGMATAQGDLQDAVPDLLRQHQLRIGGDAQSTARRTERAVFGGLHHVAAAQQLDEIAEQALVEEFRASSGRRERDMRCAMRWQRSSSASLDRCCPTPPAAAARSRGSSARWFGWWPRASSES